MVFMYSLFKYKKIELNLIKYKQKRLSKNKK